MFCSLCSFSPFFLLAPFVLIAHVKTRYRRARDRAPKRTFHSRILSKTRFVYIFCVCPGEALELSDQYTGTGTPDIVTLRHPNTGESAVFLFSPANNSVQEILTYNEAKRSWFIDESVKSDGKMQLSTPIDPIFLGRHATIIAICG